ncbi:MAG: FAD-dependent oxidoreductase [Nocardioides sp.]
MARCAGAGLDSATRPAGDLEADVAIVGAGFTGLWTAYYLAEADPTLRIVVLESEVAGFGASGRNGGWCSALFPASADKLSRLPGSSAESARAQGAAMREAVDEVGRAVAAEGIAADYAKGGTVVVARSRSQAARARVRSPTPAHGA